MRSRNPKPDVDLGRREISAMAPLVLLGGAAVTIGACGGGGGPSAPSTPAPTPTSGTCPPTPASGDVAGQVSIDPLHSAIITSAQLAAGGALTLDIRGCSTHSHTVALSAAEVQSIRQGGRIQVISTTTLGHEHSVTFN
ncbi:MAG TPA: hypothetical protein VFM88_07145 [Vicinamibacteria bacterium]|nr:hypothetical protein [Vicinamibacteria bacterium]